MFPYLSAVEMQQILCQSSVQVCNSLSLYLHKQNIVVIREDISKICYLLWPAYEREKSIKVLSFTFSFVWQGW